jgi:hypothetical protein
LLTPKERITRLRITFCICLQTVKRIQNYSWIQNTRSFGLFCTPNNSTFFFFFSYLPSLNFPVIVHHISFHSQRNSTVIHITFLTPLFCILDFLCNMILSTVQYSCVQMLL